MTITNSNDSNRYSGDNSVTFQSITLSTEHYNSTSIYLPTILSH